MKITILGAGHIGGTLAKKFAKAGHSVYVGVRNIKDPKVVVLVSKRVSVHTIPEAARKGDIIVVAVYPQATKEIAKNLGNVSKKIIIDAMNTFRGKPTPYNTTAEGLLAWTDCKDVVRCFNTTGWENIENPVYRGKKLDMFVAGDSKKGKLVATKLAKQIGFGKVYDLGGNDKFELMEQIVIAWRGLSEVLGRDTALKILKR